LLLPISRLWQHPCQIAFERDLEAFAIWLQQVASISPRMASGGGDASIFVLKRLDQIGHFRAIDVGHCRVQELRHLWRGDVSPS